MKNGFYVNETTKYVDGKGWVSRLFVHFDSPYRLGCYITECASHRQATALATVLNAALELKGQG
jgi:hypothetical protein